MGLLGSRRFSCHKTEHLESKRVFPGSWFGSNSTSFPLAGFFLRAVFTGCFHAALPPEHLENCSKHCVSLALEPPHAGFINSAPQLLPATVITHNTNILNLTLKLSPHKIKTHGGHKGFLGPNFAQVMWLLSPFSISLCRV